MGDDSSGPGPPTQSSGPSIIPDKICQTPGCNNPVLSVGRGNHQYCSDCKKARSSPASSHQHKQKRGSIVLSPIEPSHSKQSKQSKEDVFAFDFNAAFDCDLDEFLALDKSSVIAKFETLFSNTKELAEDVRCDKLRLTDQLTALREKLTTAKLALADKALNMFELSRQSNVANILNTPAQTSSSSSSTSSLPTSSTTVPTKPGIIPKFYPIKRPDSRPTLVAWLNKGVPKTEISVDKIDSLMNIDSDGPIVQLFRKTDDKVTLTFRDAAARDKAKHFLSVNLDPDVKKSIFKSVSVPQKTCPAVARLHGLADVQSITNTDSKVEKELRSAAILKSILDDNTSLCGHLSSVRVLSNRPYSCSFHVRLGLTSKSACDTLIEKGRVLLCNRSHAVVTADPFKEIRHCARCQKYSHLAHFCKASEAICGKCSGAHETSECVASSSDFKCANCSKNHAASSRACPLNARAVQQYQTYISS